MISKTILCCLLVGSVLSARLDNLYGAPAPPGANRGSGGDGSVLSAPTGGSPSNQYLPPTGQAGGPSGFPSSAPGSGSGGGGFGQGQFGSYSPQQGGQPQPFSGPGGAPQPFGGPGGAQPFGGPSGAQPFGGPSGAQPGGGSFQGGFQQPRTTPIPILHYENVNNGDGSYHFDYATGNGIQHQEEGYNRKIAPELGEQIVSGGYSYTAPDGQQISIQYKADAGGFQPVGDHLPTPPPLPQELQEAYDLHAKLFAEAAARPQLPEFQGPQGPQGYGSQQPGAPQQFGGPQPQYSAPQPSQYPGAGAPSSQGYPSGGPSGPAGPSGQGFPSATQGFPSASQGFPSASQGFPSSPSAPSGPSNQYLPPTSRPQSFSPSSGYRY